MPYWGGAGICAALGAGWFADAGAAASAMGGQVQETIEPQPADEARYAALLAIYERLYPATRDLLHALARFKANDRSH